MSTSENNRRIARNTVLLYLRMIMVTLIGLYTSRVILRNLGVSDYGIFNVLGGIIGMLGYVNVLISGAISRFLTFDLGTGNQAELRRTFQISNTLCLISIALFILFAQTVGLWFVNTHLNIEPSRMNAANWVYQCAILSASIVVLQSPFSAAVIAHEKMGIYAAVSVVDAILKMAIAVGLAYGSHDRLILYGLLMAGVSLVDFIIYLTVCLRQFDECSLRLSFEKTKFKSMFSYSGWNMVMVFANIANNYGLSILLNIFYGTVVNAARGLAMQVNSLITQLYSNFQTAAVPQITKYYAQNESAQMHSLICNTSKFSAMLLLPVVLPLCFNTEGLLSIWLEEVPAYTAAFVRIMALIALFSAIDMPIGMGIHAVGKMMLPNLTSAVIYLGVFPVSYLAMKSGASVEVGYTIFAMATPFILCTDLLILRKYTGFNILHFFSEVMLPFVKVGILTLIVPLAIHYAIPAETIGMVLVNSVIDALYAALIIFFTAVPKHIRQSIFRKICLQ